MVSKLVGDRVLVKLEGRNEMVGGIHIPEAAQEKLYRGKIVMVSKQCSEKSLKKGVTVYFTKYAGTDITMGGESLSLMRTEDIIAIQRKVR